MLDIPICCCVVSSFHPNLDQNVLVRSCVTHGPCVFCFTSAPRTRGRTATLLPCGSSRISRVPSPVLDCGERELRRGNDGVDSVQRSFREKQFVREHRQQAIPCTLSWAIRRLPWNRSTPQKTPSCPATTRSNRGGHPLRRPCAPLPRAGTNSQMRSEVDSVTPVPRARTVLPASRQTI